MMTKGDRVSVKSATVAGDIWELHKAIVYVEPEVKVTPAGVAPHEWVEGRSITGDG
jgi:PmbA protein